MINKNDVGGYEYNAAVTLIKHINRVLEQQFFEESADGMDGLGSEMPNTLTNYKSNIAIKKINVKRQSITEAQAASSTINIVAPEITTNANAQDKADRQNTARILTIGIKESIAAAITSIVGAQITNPILCITDGSDFRTVYEYNLHRILSAVKRGAKLPLATAIRQMMVDVMVTTFYWRKIASKTSSSSRPPSRRPPHTASGFIMI